MKTKIFPAALLVTAASHAIAQSSVTVYGKVDLGLVVDGGNPAGKSVRLSSGVTGGSRLGFKGVEDIGGGIKVGFQLETGYCADSAAGAPNFCSGSNNFMGRQARGDLSTSLGTVSAGRQYSLGYLNLVVIDPFAEGMAGASNNLIEGSGVRLNNSIHYTTPVYGGFSATAEMALGEKTGNWAAGRELGGSATYANGPLYAGASYYGLRNASGVGDARQNMQVGATYDFGFVKVHALAQRNIGNPSTGSRLDAMDLLAGLTIPVAGGNALLSYIHKNDKTSADQDSTQVAAGYLYPLSKRTSVYTAYAHLNNLHGAPYHVGNATDAGTGNKSFNLGVVHNF